MKPRLRAALIGGVVLGVMAALLYSAEDQVFITVGGFFSGVLAAYIYLFLRPPSAKSLYGNGAVVGLLAGLFGSVAMTLVVMATGETEAAADVIERWTINTPGVPEFFLAFAFHLYVNVIAYAILGPIGGMIGMAIIQTHLALDNSKTSKVVAVVGSALILAGTFLPLMALPLFGSISLASFIYEVHWLGLLAPSMAALCIIVVKFNQVKWCWIPGLVCIFGILYPFVFLFQHSLGAGTLNLSLTAEIVIDSGQYGVLVMGGGALLLLIAAARAALPAR